MKSFCNSKKLREYISDMDHASDITGDFFPTVVQFMFLGCLYYWGFGACNHFL